MQEVPANPNSAPEVPRTYGETPSGASTQPLAGLAPPSAYQQPETPRYEPTSYPQQPEVPRYAPVPQAPAEQPRHHGMGSAVAGPIYLIVAGVILLMNSVGILPWSIWGALSRLWPLILIAIGLDLIIGRRRPALSVILTLLVVLAGAGAILYTGFSTRGELVSTEVNLPLGDVRSAQVEIEFGTGELMLDGTADSPSLITGSIDYYSNRPGPVTEVTTNDDEAEVDIRIPDEGSFFFGWTGDEGQPKWDLHLNPDVPLSIKANVGTGNSALDLSSLQLTNLELDLGAGNSTISFPQPTGSMEATIDGGVGNIVLRIPEGVEARVSVDQGVGNVTADDRFSRDRDEWVTDGYAAAENRLEISIDSGVGNLELTR